MGSVSYNNISKKNIISFVKLLCLKKIKCYLCKPKFDKKCN